MEQNVIVSNPVHDNKPTNIDIDPFKQCYVDKSAFPSHSARIAQLTHDPRLFAVFIIEKANKIDKEKNGFRLIIDDTDNKSNRLSESLKEAIFEQRATIRDGMRIYTSTWCISREGYKKLPKQATRQGKANPPKNEEDLLTEYWEASDFVLDNYLLEKQIEVLSTVSNNNTQGLKDWQACLSKLLKDAGNDKSKRQEVKGYIEATQAILRPTADPAKFEAVVNDLSIKVARGEITQFIAETAVKFLLAVIFGLLIVAAAANPVALGAVLVAGIALVGVHSYLADENDRTPLSKGVAIALNRTGLFRYDEPKEKADELLESISGITEKPLPNLSPVEYIKSFM